MVILYFMVNQPGSIFRGMRGGTILHMSIWFTRLWDTLNAYMDMAVKGHCFWYLNLSPKLRVYYWSSPRHFVISTPSYRAQRSEMDTINQKTRNVLTGTPDGSKLFTSRLSYMSFGLPNISEARVSTFPYCAADLPEKCSVSVFAAASFNTAIFSLTLLRTYFRYGGFPGLMTLSAARTYSM